MGRQKIAIAGFRPVHTIAWVPLVILAVSCRQDPAFMETERNLSADDLVAANSIPENNEGSFPGAGHVDSTDPSGQSPGNVIPEIPNGGAGAGGQGGGGGGGNVDPNQPLPEIDNPNNPGGNPSNPGIPGNPGGNPSDPGVDPNNPGGPTDPDGSLPENPNPNGPTDPDGTNPENPLPNNPTPTPPGPTPTPSVTPTIPGGGEPTPNPTAQPTPNATVTPSPTPGATVTPSPTPGATVTPSPTPGATVTPSPTPGATVTPSPTPGATASPTPHAGSQVVVEKLQQGGKIDILWVIDNSNSMAWAQNQLASSFTSFAQALSEQNLDFKLGVTSMDACQINWSSGDPVADEYCPNIDDIRRGRRVNGVMTGPQRGEFIVDSVTNTKVLTPGADFVDAFSRIARLGVNGSRIEHGLGSARMAIQKAQSGVNPGFLRNDAALAVVVLSDEEDDGVQFHCEDGYGNRGASAADCGPYGYSSLRDMFGVQPYGMLGYTNYKYTAQNFVDYVSSSAVKGPGRTRVSAITGIKNAQGQIVCNNPNVPVGSGPLESGTNYIRAAQLTGGAVENICSSNWSTVLNNIGQNTSALATRIELPAGKIPFPGTIVVEVDGVAWASSKWTYESAGNAIVFVQLPQAGQQIKVTYRETVN